MEQILIIREAIIKFYKKFEIFILPVLKFLLGYFIFSAIAGIGYSMEAFDVITKPSIRLSYTMLMSILFTILPISIGYVLITFNIIVQFSANYEIAAIIGSVLLLAIFFYSRLGGKEKWLILFMFLSLYFKIPYIIPLIAGLYFGIQSAVPITIGVFLWEFYPLAFDLVNVEKPKAASILDIPESFGQIISFFIDTVKNNDRWMVTAFVFILVTVIVYAASKMDVDYAKEIAIAMGTVINIISFIFLRLAIGYEINIASLFILSLLSCAIVLVIKFFDIALNYQGTERVEFEDDDNYYYVRVVPKITMAKKERSVKQIKEPKKKPRQPIQKESRDFQETRTMPYVRDDEEAFPEDDLYDNYVYDEDYEDEYDDEYDNEYDDDSTRQ